MDSRYRSGRADRRPVPEEVEHPAPVQRSDDRVDELAAEELRAQVIEQDHGRRLVDDEVVAGVLRESVRVRGPRPGRDRLLPAACGRSQLGGREARGAGGSQGRDQAEFHAEVHQPGAVESGEAVDQVVESIVEVHPGTDCRMTRTAGHRPEESDGVLSG